MNSSPDLEVHMKAPRILIGSRMLDAVHAMAALAALSNAFCYCFRITCARSLVHHLRQMIFTSFSYRYSCRYNVISFLKKMSSYSVYVTRPDVPPEGLDLLKKRGYEVTTWTEKRPVPRDELIKQIANKDALFCMLTDKIDSGVLDKAASLKVVATMSVGYEHLDVDLLKKRNIAIGYTPGVLTEAVAELTLALLLATSRRLFEGQKAMLNGEWSAWSPNWMCGPSLTNSVVGIVGFGRIGQEVAKLIRPFNVKSILYSSRSEKKEAEMLQAKRVELDELLRNSDFVIVTISLVPETAGLFNKDKFSLMKPTSIFINTSRGGIVNQEDLIEALKTGKIWAAGLDVMTPEPIPTGHELLKLPNCVVIPHLGSASTDTRIGMAVMTAQNIIAALEKTKMPAQL